MNGIHNVLCRSARWGGTVERRLLPWALNGVPLHGRVLEIGPGFGATTRVLARACADLTAVEIDPRHVARLRATFGNVVRGDGTDLPFPDGSFDTVVCFTMLHHVPSRELQDRLFAEACRVLTAGGVFAGSDSLVSRRFRLLHLGDVMVPVDPATLPERLRRAGFPDPAVSTGGPSLRFRAAKHP
ncbi:class I SAM-dependent methyltransferase [Dactylosporangium sp. NPDC006015]|uniref:class I SAM-dependent methyltransferase n=1 Tax=Dactylosporangium sp. NPDC006015 TaxID=3154576 RepID=UPI0033A798B2